MLVDASNRSVTEEWKVSDAMNDLSVQGMSATGLGVAGSRAAESARPDHLFVDPVALRLVEEADGSIPSADDEAPFVRGYFSLRTVFFDRTVARALERGCAQVVILAAGMDGRAFRLGLGTAVTVFEVDMPDLMAMKNAFLDRAALVPTCRRHGLGVDLREDWPASLERAGFDPTVATHWVLEGILPYLSQEDADLTLRRVSALSAAGSSLALEHINGATLTMPHIASMLDDLEAEGAAWRSAVDDPASWLVEAGWSSPRFTDVADLARSLGRPVPDGMNPDLVGDARCWLAEAVRAEAPSGVAESWGGR